MEAKKNLPRALEMPSVPGILAIVALAWMQNLFALELVASGLRCFAVVAVAAAVAAAAVVADL